METLNTVAEQFTPDDSITEVAEFGNENINDTYIVTYAAQEKFVPQRITPHVFKHPHLIMQNMRAFTEHVHQRVQKEGRFCGIHRASSLPKTATIFL